MQPEVWSTFTRDPRDPHFGGLRASDQDRALVQEVLAESYAEGRLDQDELEERSARASAVRTLGEIRPLLADLVAAPPPGGALVHASPRELERLAHRAWRSKRKDAALSFVGASTISTAIWVATCFGDGGFKPYFFWPAFVIVLSLLHLIRTVASRAEIVETELRRLERRRERAQRKRKYGRRP